MLITGAMIADKVKKVVDVDDIEIIAEPVGKNTAPAIALAAAMIVKRYDDGVMIVVSADHAIKPVDDFVSAVKCAVTVACDRDDLVVFGIKPSRPETGYGYIELGDSIDMSALTESSSSNNNGDSRAFVVKKFVEKPTAENANMFMTSGNFLWNSGMFVWKASTILKEFHEHMPELYDLAMTASEQNFSHEAINNFYMTCKSESIDFGIMEKAKDVSVVCGNFFWDDLGSWEALGRVLGSNDVGTTIDGSLIYENDCTNSLVVNKSNRTLAVVGLDNVAVVTVDDATLVIERSRLPDLKKYLGEIKSHKNFSAELF